MKVFQALAGYALMASLMDVATPPELNETKQISKGIQLSRKVWQKRAKRLRMQKQSRKLNRV